MDKANNKKGPLKCKNMMYVQQLRHLNGTVEDLAERIKTMKSPPSRYALIVHDQDIDKDGNPEEPHVHVMMCFGNARHVTAIAKALGDKPQQIQVWDDRADNGFAYLLHITKGRKNARQYDPKTVIANFDYQALMKKLQIEVEQKESSAHNIRDMLDMLLLGIMTKKQIYSMLSGSQFAKWHRQIEDVYAQYLKNSAEKWRQQMIDEGRRLEFIWINGPAGVGKTRLARDYAERRGQPYFVTGSGKDPFQNYAGEHTLIIDEMRAETLSYRELLRLTDPFGMYGGMVNAPSRYSDKSLACDLIIVTSPYRSNGYYHSIFDGMPRNRQEIDSYQQLARRITLWLEMNEYCIHGYIYDGKDWFNPIEQKGRPNPYASRAQPVTQDTDSKMLFDSIVAKPAGPAGDTEAAPL